MRLQKIPQSDSKPIGSNFDGRASIKVSLVADQCEQVRDVIEALSVLEEVYNNLYAWNLLTYQADHPSGEGFHDKGHPPGKLLVVTNVADAVPTEDRLCLAQIEIEPPGFVEIVGAQKVLHTMHEYLANHHGDIVRQGIDRLRSLNYPEGQIREALFRHILAPLARLDNLPGVGLHKEHEENDAFERDIN